MIAWLRQQLDTYEQIARAVEPLGHIFDMGGNRLDERFTHRRARYRGEDGTLYVERDAAAQAHFARHDPARALRQVQAHRAILDVVASWRHTTCDDSWYSCSQATVDNGYDEYLACANDDRHGEPCDCGLEVHKRKILGPLVSIYSDHPDYRQEWPDG